MIIIGMTIGITVMITVVDLHTATMIGIPVTITIIMVAQVTSTRRRASARRLPSA
jgi:UDP-N-acetylmuramyl pentapeptide phosphotransferase/UDP-N-acetylglucosamine-1-phosphate transferase